MLDPVFFIQGQAGCARAVRHTCEAGGKGGRSYSQQSAGRRRLRERAQAAPSRVFVTSRGRRQSRLLTSAARAPTAGRGGQPAAVSDRSMLDLGTRSRGQRQLLGGRATHRGADGGACALPASALLAHGVRSITMQTRAFMAMQSEQRAHAVLERGVLFESRVQSNEQLQQLLHKQVVRRRTCAKSTTTKAKRPSPPGNFFAAKDLLIRYIILPRYPPIEPAVPEQ